MSNTTTSLEQEIASHNPLGVKGIDHIEFILDDADKWRDYYVNRFGMYPRAYAGPETGIKGRRAHIVGQGRVNFLLAEPCGDGPEAEPLREHLEKHGCGVKDVAFRVSDASAALIEAEKRGAKVVRAIDDHEQFTAGSIASYGDTIHTLIERKPHTEFAPHYINVAGGIEESDIQFMMIDHVVANVEVMEDWVEYYARVFGFETRRHFDINTGRSALMSKVVGNEEGYIKLPINEPSSENSQIKEYLDEYNGPGVQHIALLTSDIISTVKAMRQQGLEFLDIPDTYYEREVFEGRVGEIDEKLEDVQKYQILVDRDRPDGYLLQLFTRCVFARPTLFFEVIQRKGNSDGFGEGNFTALFEAIEREQARRGTL